MSSGPETRFIKSIHRLLPEELYHEKMSNPYRGGTPDVWYSGDKADIWVEYKYGKNWLSELQRLWLEARIKEGRKGYVIVGNPTGGEVHLTLDKDRGIVMTKSEIAAWLVGQTMRKTNDSKKTVRSGRKHGQRIQNSDNGSADTRTGKV